MSNRQKGLRLLSKLFPTSNQVRLICDFAEIPTHNVDFNAGVLVVWNEVLKQAENREKVCILLEVAREEYPTNNELGEIFEAECGHGGNNVLGVDAGTKMASVSSDKSQELVDFRKVALNIDDQAYEKIIGGRDDMVEIEWLEKAIKASNSVCKIMIPTSEGYRLGTGWVFRNKFLVTNNHVITTIDDAKKAKVIFNYQMGQGGSAKEYKLNPDEAFYYSAPNALDFTCVPFNIDDEEAFKEFGSLTVNPGHNFEKGELVNIIQHPQGQVKKMAMPDEVISMWPDKNYVFYKADTDGGSSGSPVFNQNWEVVALHHAGLNEQQGGIQINAAGDKEPANRGIYISEIVKAIDNQ